MVELTKSNTFLDKCLKRVASDAPCGSGSILPVQLHQKNNPVCKKGFAKRDIET